MQIIMFLFFFYRAILAALLKLRALNLLFRPPKKEKLCLALSGSAALAVCVCIDLLLLLSLWWLLLLSFYSIQLTSAVFGFRRYHVPNNCTGCRSPESCGVNTDLLAILQRTPSPLAGNWMHLQQLDNFAFVYLCRLVVFISLAYCITALTVCEGTRSWRLEKIARS